MGGACPIDELELDPIHRPLGIGSAISSFDAILGYVDNGNHESLACFEVVVDPGLSVRGGSVVMKVLKGQVFGRLSEVDDLESNLALGALELLDKCLRGRSHLFNRQWVERVRAGLGGK